MLTLEGDPLSGSILEHGKSYEILWTSSFVGRVKVRPRHNINAVTRISRCIVVSTCHTETIEWKSNCGMGWDWMGTKRDGIGRVEEE